MKPNKGAVQEIRFSDSDAKICPVMSDRKWTGVGVSLGLWLMHIRESRNDVIERRAASVTPLYKDQPWLAGWAVAQSQQKRGRVDYDGSLRRGAIEGERTAA